LWGEWARDTLVVISGGNNSVAPKPTFSSDGHFQKREQLSMGKLSNYLNVVYLSLGELHRLDWLAGSGRGEGRADSRRISRLIRFTAEGVVPARTEDANY
jgi:hypothetical protein